MTTSQSRQRTIQNRTSLGFFAVVQLVTIDAAPSPVYFGMRRGATCLNAVNDQLDGSRLSCEPSPALSPPSDA